ncbi:Cof-type HAD-IIB family hydrolase [Streptococcus iniae]|uniref:Cof-type HAD-IIB family hydrolase n=1 Tax=Streptococcus iniae TaxID=1346 RepID=UPI0008D9A366|nr:Cof-type HAD-IIB family hydrolase [Streptococcus iniae]OHX26548.1 haloacid dehalogenase [Streptococcus iniae]RLV28191.1 Cof-type HAD-IIB family hydrolase [Streptococcus iniae]
MNYKGIVFFDLDGTLLNASSHISYENRHALKQLRANGYLPVIATGRSVKELDTVLEESGIDSVAMLNGMVVQVEGQIISSETIDKQDIKDTLQLARSLGESIAYYTPKELILADLSEGLKQHFKYFHGPTPRIDDNYYLDHDVNMILVGASNKDNDHFYKKAVPNLQFLRNSPFSIDVVKTGFNKGTGVNTIKKYLGLSDLPTYGFGDGGNDLDLLKAVDHPIAMENAIAELKELAEFITHKNTEDGILFGLKHYGLI